MVDPATATNAFWNIKASDVVKLIPEVLKWGAWPFTVLVITLTFRSHLVALLKKVSKINTPWGSVDLLSKIEAKVDEVLEAESRSTPTGPARDQDLPPPSATPAPSPIPPNQAVRRAWSTLLSTLVVYGRQGSSPVERKMRHGDAFFLQELHNTGRISDSEFEVLRGMQRLVELADDPTQTVSEQEAARFSDIAAKLNVVFTHRPPATPAVQPNTAAASAASSDSALQ